LLWIESKLGKSDDSDLLNVAGSLVAVRRLENTDEIYGVGLREAIAAVNRVGLKEVLHCVKTSGRLPAPASGLRRAWG
jgi:hypothetical protein